MAIAGDDVELNFPVGVFSTWRKMGVLVGAWESGTVWAGLCLIHHHQQTWRQMADRPPREGRKKRHKTRPRRAFGKRPPAPGCETQVSHSSERAVEGPAIAGEVGRKPGMSPGMAFFSVSKAKICVLFMKQHDKNGAFRPKFADFFLFAAL